MPKILDKAVSKLQSKGKSKDSAYAIATSSLQKAGKLKKGTHKKLKKSKRKKP